MREHGSRETTDTRAPVPATAGSLLVASNRQPYRHEFLDEEASAADGGVDAGEVAGRLAGAQVTVDCPAGGLTAGLDPVLSQSGGTWIAWGDGEADQVVVDENDCVAVPPGDGDYTLRRVWLSEDAVDGYYYGYSNRVLWPTCHELPEYVEARPGDRECYERVNRWFAEAIAEHASEGTLVWLQDYHLGLAPAMVREATDAAVTIAQFWHIPWPTPDAIASSPVEGDLLAGLLGNDVLGFHVDRFAECFLSSVDRFLPDATVDVGERTVHHGGGETRVVVTPMGVDATAFDRQSRALDGSRWREFRERHGVSADVTIGLGVDRLDYSKGIPERLGAIERLLERRPDLRGSFTFVQKATPSRTDIPTYEAHGRAVRATVDRINDRFGTDDWRPIVYTEAYLERADLCALYRAADVMVVSPLLDGMNLVAQEYLAASVDGEGALVLSDRAGVADVLGDDVYRIDPTDEAAFADQLEAALGQPTIEGHRRLTRLRNHVFEYDLAWWMARQFELIERVRTGEDPEDEPGSDDAPGPEPSVGCEDDRPPFPPSSG